MTTESTEPESAGARSSSVVVPQVPLAAVPIEIGLKSLAGIDRFEIRLDPEDLGRIDVRLDFGAEGGVKAELVIDRAETLNLLQRDARSLDRALEQAGLKPSDQGVSFLLRDPSSQGQNGREGRSRDDDRAGHPDTLRAEDAESPRAAPLRRLWSGAVGIDLRV